MDPRTRMEGEVSQRNPLLPSAVVRCAGHHEPVAACADFFIRVSENPAPALSCGEPRGEMSMWQPVLTSSSGSWRAGVTCGNSCGLGRAEVES